MGATSLTQLLKGFCHNTPWKYAVFWKLDHHFPMTLTWENGYQKRDEALEIESIWGDISFKSLDEVYSSCESIDDSGDYSARLLMIEMSHRKYSLGEGVVGKIALTGDHCWVLCEDISALIPECPDEWLLQFASGIKTIVLVPVLPQGVLQFGSCEAVAEDLEFVTNIMEKFHSVHSLEADTAPLNTVIDYHDWSFSAPSNNLMDSFEESSSITDSILKGEVSTSAALNVNGSTSLNATMASFIQDGCCLSREDQLKSLEKVVENEIGSTSVDMSHYPRHVGQMETKSNHMDEEIRALSNFINNVGVFEEMPNGLGSYTSKNIKRQHFGDIETGLDDFQNVNDFTFPSASELHEALGSIAYRQTGQSLSKYISVEDTYSSSTLISNKNEHDHINHMEFPDPETLFDAVVGNCSASNDASIISNSIKSLMAMPIESGGSIQPKINSETLIVKNSDIRSGSMPAAMVKGRDEFTNHFTSPSFDGSSSLLVDEARQENSQAISGPKLLSTNKKRGRAGNNPKGRPRDRQLIMDRMRELRELVPDGGRCSIDNLLERTIKHMLYLRKVTSQAEKLKRFANREVPEYKKQKINGSHPGRSCAFDCESELAWPIVIEDLECSGHMLIEMICNEHGLFLEIAQVIRKLDLTILKGILENRSSNSWACFIVEVPRGFHRMDVLCPLLHLLQLRKNPLSYKS